MAKIAYFCIIVFLFWAQDADTSNTTVSVVPTWKGYRCRNTQSRGIIECSLSNGVTKQYENSEDKVENTGSAMWWFDLMIVATLVLSAGLMSGLTIGLMGLDITTLDILSKSGSEKQKVYAKRILPLLKRHHLLLVTLLLMNAISMEALPIFLERLVPPLVAVIVSVTLILLFGEILPQSLCTRYGLAIGGHLCYLVWVLIALCFVIAYPIGKLLDCLIGTDHGTFFKRAELKQLIDLHGKKNAIEGTVQGEEALSPDEITIIKGALDLKDKTAFYVMTPLKETFMLNVDKKMNQKAIQRVVDSGHSRIPVYQGNREHIVGLLLVKNLLLLDPFEETPIASLELCNLRNVSANLPLYDMLNIFQQGSHMAVVVDSSDHVTPLGIITMESVIEELLLQEITDETDHPNPTANEGDGDEDNEGKHIVLEPKEKQVDETVVKEKVNTLTPKSKTTAKAKKMKEKLSKVMKFPKTTKKEDTTAPLLNITPEKVHSYPVTNKRKYSQLTQTQEEDRGDNKVENHLICERGQLVGSQEYEEIDLNENGSKPYPRNF